MKQGSTKKKYNKPSSRTQKSPKTSGKPPINSMKASWNSEREKIKLWKEKSKTF